MFLPKSLLVALAVLLLLLALAGALVLLKTWAERKLAGSPVFDAKPLLTPNELEFLSRLEAAAPELRFHAQVAMGALLEPRQPKGSKGYLAIRNLVSQKVVDFVAQDRRDGAIVAIIELDDGLHDRWRDLKRDEMAASAGYRTIRWQSKATPNADAIRAELGVIRNPAPRPARVKS